MRSSVRYILVLGLVGLSALCALVLLGPSISRFTSSLLPTSATPQAASVPTKAPVALPTEPAAAPNIARQPSPPPPATATRPPTNTPALAESPTPSRPSATVTHETLNARSGPGTAYPVLATLARGDVVWVLGRNKAGDWIQVEMASGKQGWVWAEYTALSMPVDQVALVANIPKPPTPAATRTPAPPTATLTVDEQIAKVAKGEHGALGQPGESGGVSAGGEAEVTIINDTPHALTILIGSPSSTTITIEACPVCKEYGTVGPLYCPEEGRTRTTVRLKPGTSQVVARVSDPSVIAFYGTWELRADTAYFNCFYISSSWR